MSEVKSYLYIPTIKEKYYEKINSNNADAIIFDLEDSVKYENKEEARELLQKFFNKDKVLSDNFIVWGRSFIIRAYCDQCFHWSVMVNRNVHQNVIIA